MAAGLVLAVIYPAQDDDIVSIYRGKDGDLSRREVWDFDELPFSYPQPDHLN